MSDFFDNIDEVEIDSSFTEEQEYDKPKHKFVVQAFVGDRYDNEQIKRIVCSCLNKLRMDLKYDVVITTVTAIAEFVQSNGIKPSVQVNIDVYGDFKNIYEVVDFIDALCFGRYVHVINGNLQFPTMYIEYQSPGEFSNELHKDSKWTITLNRKFTVFLEITPDIYLSQNNSDFDKNDHIVQAYINSLITICHLSIDENNANESELRHCLGFFDKDSLYHSQKYHAFCIGVNDIITYDSDLNIENISSVCFSEGDTLGQEKWLIMLELFTMRAKRIKNLDRILNEDIRDDKGRGLTKTIGCALYEPNDKDRQYVAVWDGFPNVHHPENSQYAFFMKLFYENREQLKRKYRFPTASVPNVVFYNQETDYIKIVLRLGSIYDVKTKNTLIITMGLCGHFDNVINHINILYDL